MTAKQWRRCAMEFVATYERPGADAYERHVARLARRWMGLIGSRRATQRLVDNLLDELSVPPPAEYGCGWDELRKQFTAWGIEAEWLEQDEMSG